MNNEEKLNEISKLLNANAGNEMKIAQINSICDAVLSEYITVESVIVKTAIIADEYGCEFDEFYKFIKILLSNKENK